MLTLVLAQGAWYTNITFAAGRYRVDSGAGGKFDYASFVSTSAIVDPFGAPVPWTSATIFGEGSAGWSGRGGKCRLHDLS